MRRHKMAIIAAVSTLVLGLSAQASECVESWAKCFFEKKQVARQEAQPKKQVRRPAPEVRLALTRPKQKVREHIPDRLDSPYAAVIIVNLDSGWYAVYQNGALAKVEISAGRTVTLKSDVAAGTKENPTPVTDEKKGPEFIISRARRYVSKKYDAPMPFAQFLGRPKEKLFGHAFHAGEVRGGVPLSHGCVRLPEEQAQALWKFIDVVDKTEDRVRVIIVRNMADFDLRWRNGLFRIVANVPKPVEVRRN